jgi:Mg-chelatase subunit ChlD
MAFNPLDPQQTQQAGSFAAKLAAREARAKGGDADSVDVSTLSESERAQLTRTNNLQKAAEEFKFAPANKATERIKIVFDDSSSMAYKKIQDAHDGVIEFMQSSEVNETAVSIAPLNDVAHPFTTNLPSLALTVKKISARGGTPLYEVTQQNMAADENGIKPTRMILFSDGEPNGAWGYNPSDSESKFPTLHTQTITQAQELKIPLDTVLIADAGYSKESKEYLIMKDLAEKTGGIFLVFEAGKGSFKKGFKYLTKGNRLLLMDSSFKAALESGEVS